MVEQATKEKEIHGKEERQLIGLSRSDISREHLVEKEPAT